MISKLIKNTHIFHALHPLEKALYKCRYCIVFIGKIFGETLLCLQRMVAELRLTDLVMELAFGGVLKSLQVKFELRYLDSAWNCIHISTNKPRIDGGFKDSPLKFLINGFKFYLFTTQVCSEHVKIKLHTPSPLDNMSLIFNKGMSIERVAHFIQQADICKYWPNWVVLCAVFANNPFILDEPCMVPIMTFEKHFIANI